MKHLLLDGFNIAFRAYHAVSGLARADGFPTGAIHGWTRLLWKLCDQEAPCRTTVFFDKDGSRRHRELLPAYKANRPEAPVDFTLQIPELKTLAALLGCRVVAQSGVEADDLIASAAKALAAKGDDVRIASADKDFAQCVNERVHLLAPPPPGHGKDSWRELDAAGVRAKFGVPPEQIVDYLSLIGDSVDNIPGLPGVGPKTAVSWLAAHGSIEGILAARESVEPVRMREVLRGADAVLALNRKLITFASDFPGDWAAAAEMDIAGARAFFQRMEMRAVLGQLEQRLGVATGTGTPKPPVPLPQQLELF